jgi:hypothetical protein
MADWLPCRPHAVSLFYMETLLDVRFDVFTLELYLLSYFTNSTHGDWMILSAGLQGIDMLIKDFDYHLAYKRWWDQNKSHLQQVQHLTRENLLQEWLHDGLDFKAQITAPLSSKLFLYSLCRGDSFSGVPFKPK